MDRTEESIDSAARHVRDRHIAEAMTLAIVLAAQYHPEEVRHALGKVFDLSCIEEATKNAMVTLAKVQRDVADCRSLLWTTQRDCDRLRQELNDLEYKRSSQGRCPYCKESYIDLSRHLGKCVKVPKEK
jgi:hypothetical protein